MPTEDGYPTDDELARIREWPGADLPGWFAFIRSCWWASDWGWSEERTTEISPPLATALGRQFIRYYVSTGGWSGNEEIIGAMQDNVICWSMTWLSCRRGGHYVFERPA